MKMHYPPELISGLEAYGLDKKEAKVYLAGLELGATTVLEISRRTKLPRTTLYPMLEKLRRRGVFKVGKRKSTTIYIAYSPQRLLEKMRERQIAVEQCIPSLEVLQETAQGGPGVIFFEGTEGFKRLWKQIYNSGVKEYRLITCGTGLLDYVKEPYLVNRIIEERKQRGIKSFQLIRDSKNAKKIIERDPFEMRESRILPADVNIPATVIIFADQVAFITTRRENAMIILASGDVAATYKTLFDLVWDKAEKPNTSIE